MSERMSFRTQDPDEEFLSGEISGDIIFHTPGDLRDAFLKKDKKALGLIYDGFKRVEELIDSGHTILELILNRRVNDSTFQAMLDAYKNYGLKDKNNYVQKIEQSIREIQSSGQLNY